MTLNYLENSDVVLEQGYESDEKIPTKITGLAHFYVILLSLLVSLISITLPVLNGFASTEQTQYLYTGLMMSKGVLPYNDIYATGGFLYYAIIALAYRLGSPLWLILAQFVANYFSGRYLYKIVTDWTNSGELAVAINLLFYLFNAILGFGGLYPIQWAMPFLLSMIWFLSAYVKGLVTDEGFIRFGLVSLIGMFIEPRLLLFWVIATVMLFSYNLTAKRFARGFYQALCFIFGALVVVYTVGYFIFNEQLLTAYLAQPIVFYMTVFQSGQENMAISMGYQAAIILASGLIFTFKTEKNKLLAPVKAVLITSILIYSVYALLSQSFAAYHLLFLFVQGLILASLRLSSIYHSSLANRSHRRHRRSSVAKHFFYQYFTTSYLLPLVMMVLVVGQLVYHYWSEFPLASARQQVASFITEHSKQNTKIYVWDNQADIYLKSERPSVSRWTLPVQYTVTAQNKQALEDSLLADKAEFLIVKNGAHLSQAMQTNFAKHYKQVLDNNSNAFMIYQLK